MQYDANTPTEYLDVLEEDWRNSRIDKFIEKALGLWKDGIDIGC